ncbi:hypothetical protein [Chloroflexus sp.]|uniref:hypothetical protein n=1 Tax=Chloroflexus sp. TaxID=1904827 RepID=UPI002ACEC4C1|nr:hypothetical protein [Chloroflexus sp.]MCX7860263.1 hypothetical protein [Chloroflexus sp.]
MTAQPTLLAMIINRKTTMPPITLIIAVLAIWRLTHLLHAEDGPWDLFARLRQWAGSGFWGQLLDCFYCLSLWCALPVALYYGATWIEAGLYWLAFSGGAIVLERLTAPKPVVYEMPFQGGTDVMLRQEPSTERDERRAAN